MRCVFALIVFTAVFAQAQEAWFGTWQLNIAKSSASPDDRFKRSTTKIEPWGVGLKVTYDIVGTRGGVTHMEWIGKFDGKDYPVQGVDYVLTNAYSQIDDRSYRIVIKIDGAESATATVSVSTDGKTLTTVTSGKNAQGDTVQTTSIYERNR